MYIHGKTSFLPPHRAAHNLRFIAAEGKYLTPDSVLSTKYIFLLHLFQESVTLQSGKAERNRVKQ